jgi:hypothetical protein
MIRSLSLRLAAAFFIITACAFAAAPASAGGAGPAAAPTESAYAAVLRTINPKLPLAKARAYARSVMADAWRTHLDPRFIMSIVTVESAWRSNALSRVGARGLGQLMPHTAALLGVNAWNPADNLRGTSSYLKTLMDHFAGKPNATKLAIAGYNAGPKAVERYHGVPPYTETRNYVVRVLHVWKQLDTRVGRAFAPAAVTIAVRPHQLPDERQWLTDINEVLPATAAAVESVPNPALAPESVGRTETIVAPPGEVAPGSEPGR